MAAIAARRRSQRLLRGSILLMHTLTALSSLAMMLLVYALVISDFSITYVQGHSSRAMPIFYRITGVWAGMEGSMLTWVWSLALVSSLAVHVNRERLKPMLPHLVAVLMSVVVFFGVIMVLHSNPFLAYLTAAPTTGQGMNPLLQNPYMVTHPPALYLGFVGLTIPFAFAFASLLAGRRDDAWVRAARPWGLWAWYFLALGLVLGMLWAYEELGWGGYWGWDPVENAAFMPWLLATAFLHSIIVVERRQMLRAWSVISALLAFVMTIFGTFMTRSGFISSVHAFARSNIGYVFLVYIAVLLIGGFGIVIWRRRLLQGNYLQSWISREAFVLYSNWVFLLGSLAVMVLTVLPNISELFGDKIAISISMFIRYMVPIGLALLGLTAVGPMLGWRRPALRSLRRQLLIPLITAIVTAVAIVVLGVRRFTPVLTWALASFLFSTIIQELVRAARMRVRAGGAGFLGALMDQIADNRRRYGGYIVHIGVAMMCIGFAGDAFKTKKDVVLKLGQRVTVGQYTLRYDGLNIQDDLQKTAISAGVTIFEDGKSVGTMRPARWVFFSRPKDPTSEVSILRSVREDLFVALGGYGEGGAHASFMVVINPLVNWIWIGFLAMTLGALVGGFPLPRRRQIAAAKGVGR